MEEPVKIWLSKSTLLQSLQCPKALYLQKNYYNLRDKPSKETLELFREGRSIEQEAREQLFPGGINLQPKSPRQWSKVAQATKQLIQNGEEYIYEATFVANGVMCAVDVVKVISPNEIELFEIKRGTSLKTVYMNDAAIQYAIINQLGYQIKSSKLVHPVDLEQEVLEFAQEDVLMECLEREQFILDQINICKQILSKSHIPDIARGEQCYSPYACAFIGFCTQQEQLINE